jgi:hypothetical protein
MTPAEVRPDNVTPNAPERIWLQVDATGDAEDRSEPLSPDDWDELTWCAESVGGVEVEYVRADKFAALVAERESFKREAAAQLQEMEDMHTLIMRQGDLLTGVVNAIRGEPAENCRHSHHDAAELAAKVVAERDRLLTVREVLKRECEALKAERDALRALLRRADAELDFCDDGKRGRRDWSLGVEIDDTLSGAGHVE